MTKVNKAYFPTFDLYNLKLKDKWKSNGWNLERSHDGKIVFLCGEDNFEVGLTVALAMSPTLRGIIRQLCSCSHFLTADQKIYVTLDGDFDAMTLGSLFSWASSFNLVDEESLKLSVQQAQQIKDLVSMLQINPKLINVESLPKINKSKVEEETEGKIVSLSEQTEAIDVEERPKTQTELKPRLEARKEELEAKNAVTAVSILKPKKSGTKRKNLNDALENIVAKKIRSRSQIPESSKVPIETEEEETVNVLETLKRDPVVSVPVVSPPLNVIEEARRVTEPREDRVYQDDQEPIKANADVESRNATPSKVPDSIKCPVENCNLKDPFKVRPEFLQHAVFEHLQATLLESYPFTKSSNCPVCVDKKAKKSFNTKNKQVNQWIIHVLTHEEVLECLPTMIKETAAKLPKRLRTNTKKGFVLEAEDKNVREDPEERTPSESNQVPKESKMVVHEGQDSKMTMEETVADLHQSYVEPSFDPKEAAMEIDASEETAAEFGDSTLPMETEDSPVSSTNSTQVGMELQPMASLPSSLEFPQPIAHSSTVDMLIPSNSTESIGMTKLRINSEAGNETLTSETDETQQHPCKFCSLQRVFESREKLLRHMCLVHFMSDILDKFPYQVIIPILDHPLSTTFNAIFIHRKVRLSAPCVTPSPPTRASIFSTWGWIMKKLSVS